MKIAIVLGTRPEIIKLASVIKECERLALDYFILHTGQHYSYNMDEIFFRGMELPSPRYNLKVGSGTYAEELSKMLVGIERILIDEKPDIVLVEGDTNSCIAGALAASKCGVEVGHIEAGLRSYFSGMPEEINRVLADHCSHYLFAPTEEAKQNLIGESIDPERVFVTGNTIVDALMQANVGKTDGAGNYMLVTLHRQENVDDMPRFKSILQGLELVAKEYRMPMLYPMHPRAKNMMDKFGLELDSVKTIDPTDYYSFLVLENNAALILTDSGGVQEEACILGIPCVTLRDNTERPETVSVGANLLAGASPEKILECAKIMMGGKDRWDNPFGDGKAAERIIEIVREAIWLRYW